MPIDDRLQLAFEGWRNVLADGDEPCKPPRRSLPSEPWRIGLQKGFFATLGKPQEGCNLVQDEPGGLLLSVEHRQVGTLGKSACCGELIVGEVLDRQVL